MSERECNLHGVALESGLVPVRYGLVTFPPGYRSARELYFPNSMSYLLGGCVIGEEKQSEALFCPECRRAEKRWQRDHTPARGGAI